MEPANRKSTLYIVCLLIMMTFYHYSIGSDTYGFILTIIFGVVFGGLLYSIISSFQFMKTWLSENQSAS